MERAYRADLVAGCPMAADDTLFYSGLVEACAIRVLQFCRDFRIQALLQNDRTIAVSTARQIMLERFAIVAAATQQYGHLTSLGEALRDMGIVLQTRWSAEMEALPPYPAFR